MRFHAVTLAALLPFTFSGECDLAKTEKGFYCDDCSEVRSRTDLVSDAVYYTCDGCGILSKAAGDCDDCEKPLAKQTSGKDVCPECFTKPDAVDLCVKTYYECGHCGTQSSRAGSCPDCNAALEARTSRALVEYECAECGDTGRKPAKCTDSSCPNSGQPMAKRCTESGQFPHGGDPN